jgi:serine/threonine protein kinase
VRQVISALRYMQKPENMVLHRDLKLGNLFLDSKMQVKIGDFGLATQLQATIDMRASICGTPNYMAPEIIFA